MVYFACFTEGITSNSTALFNNSGSLSLCLLQHPSTAALAQHLSQRVDAIMVANTYGDAKTSLLLDLIRAMRAEASVVQGSGATLWHPPRVIMDLPNLGLPEEWKGKVDGFVAPSRAVGLHTFTLVHGQSRVL